MTTLMVTPFAPYRDGISVYAQEELRRLRRQGEQVEVLSPLPSAAHHHLPLGGSRGAAQLAARAADYERVVVQFAPEMLFGRCRAGAERALVWTALASAAARTKLELRLHEVIYEWLDTGTVERNAARLALRAAHRVTVHTEVEKAALVKRLGSVAHGIEVVDHGAHFTKRVDLNRHEAKRRLGLDPREMAFLCIGFLQHSKGFDRAVEAAAVAERIDRAERPKGRGPGFRLHVVGTGRVDNAETESYVQDLRAMCTHSPTVSLHERFVSDLEFDTWVAAADVVVVPYRQIWSSGVVERARLYDTPLIASDLPPLVDQIPADSSVCDSVKQMAEVMVDQIRLDRVNRRQTPAPGNAVPPQPAGEPGRVGPEESSWIVDRVEPDRTLIQKQIRHRAELGRNDTTNRADRDRVFRPPSTTSPLGELSAMHGVPRAPVSSARPGVSQVKNVVQRLTAWQVDPIAHHVDELQCVIVDTVLDLEARLTGANNSDLGATDGPAATDKIETLSKDAN